MGKPKAETVAEKKLVGGETDVIIKQVTDAVAKAPVTLNSDESIKALIGAKSFNIAHHKVDDFRQSAQSELYKAIVFSLGKPAGSSQGVALLTKSDSNHEANAVVRRLGKSTKFARPTLEFLEPELQPYLERIHLIPGVDVTGPNPTGFLWPSRITAWDGYECIFNALADLGESQGLFIKYSKAGEGDPGSYVAEPFDLEEKHKTILQNVNWPTADEVPELLPQVPFEQLIAENFNLKRAWQAVLRRREGGK